MMERGMVKWAPFNSVINGNDVKKVLNDKKNKISKPNLSEEQIEEIENSIINAYSNKTSTTIIYYYSNKFIQINGIITKLDPINKRIFINGKYLYFNNIVKFL